MHQRLRLFFFVFPLGGFGCLSPTDTPASSDDLAVAGMDTSCFEVDLPPSIGLSGTLTEAQQDVIWDAVVRDAHPCRPTTGAVVAGPFGPLRRFRVNPFKLGGSEEVVGALLKNKKEFTAVITRGKNGKIRQLVDAFPALQPGIKAAWLADVQDRPLKQFLGQLVDAAASAQVDDIADIAMSDDTRRNTVNALIPAIRKGEGTLDAALLREVATIFKEYPPNVSARLFYQRSYGLPPDYPALNSAGLNKWKRTTYWLASDVGESLEKATNHTKRLLPTIQTNFGLRSAHVEIYTWGDGPLNEVEMVFSGSNDAIQSLAMNLAHHAQHKLHATQSRLKEALKKPWETLRETKVVDETNVRIVVPVPTLLTGDFLDELTAVGIDPPLGHPSPR